jgi:hypothetical protein
MEIEKATVPLHSALTNLCVVIASKEGNQLADGGGGIVAQSVPKHDFQSFRNFAWAARAAARFDGMVRVVER